MSRILREQWTDPYMLALELREALKGAGTGGGGVSLAGFSKQEVKALKELADKKIKEDKDGTPPFGAVVVGTIVSHRGGGVYVINPVEEITDPPGPIFATHPQLDDADEIPKGRYVAVYLSKDCKLKNGKIINAADIIANTFILEPTWVPDSE